MTGQTISIGGSLTTTVQSQLEVLMSQLVNKHQFYHIEMELGLSGLSVNSEKFWNFILVTYKFLLLQLIDWLVWCFFKSPGDVDIISLSSFDSDSLSLNILGVNSLDFISTNIAFRTANGIEISVNSALFQTGSSFQIFTDTEGISFESFNNCFISSSNTINFNGYQNQINLISDLNDIDFTSNIFYVDSYFGNIFMQSNDQFWSSNNIEVFANNKILFSNFYTEIVSSSLQVNSPNFQIDSREIYFTAGNTISLISNSDSIYFNLKSQGIGSVSISSQSFSVNSNEINIFGGDIFFSGTNLNQNGQNFNQFANLSPFGFITHSATNLISFSFTNFNLNGGLIKLTSTTSSISSNSNFLSIQSGNNYFFVDDLNLNSNNLNFISNLIQWTGSLTINSASFSISTGNQFKGEIISDTTISLISNKSNFTFFTINFKF